MKKKSINTFRKEQIQMLADYLLENFSGEMGNVGWRNKESWKRNPHGESAVEVAIRLLRRLIIVEKQRKGE